MKNLLFQIVPVLKYLGVCTVLTMALVACTDNSVQKEDNLEPTPDSTPEYPEEPVVNEEVKTVAQMVAGFVRDAEGNALSGVTVTTGSQRTMTDVNGLFSFTEIGAVGGRGVFRFSKEGYFDIVRSFEQECEQFDVVMLAKGNGSITVSESFTAEQGKKMEVSGMKVDIPASSLVDKSGNVYSGQVQMDMIYMDPNNEHFADMMPGGDLTAVRTDNSSVQLLSYGMVGVNLTGSDGKELQLKEGERSTITFPLPEGMEDNAPDVIPLWHFNEKAGVWVESGEATRQGNEYVGTVGHFSYWNLDTPEGRGKVEVYVYMQDCDDENEDLKPMLGVKVHIGQKCDYTDIHGHCNANVPANIPIDVYLDDKGLPIDVTPYRKTVVVEPGGVETVIFVIECFDGFPGIPCVMANVKNDQGFISVAARLDYDFFGIPRSYSMISYTGYIALFYQWDNMGTATMTLTELGTGKLLYTQKVELTGLNVDLGTINISSDTSLGGTFHVNYTGNDGKQESTSIGIPNIDSSTGVIVVDDEFYASSIADDSEDTFDMMYSGYSFEKTNYQNVFAYVSEGNIVFDSENLTASIVEEEDELFRIKLSGKGEFVDGNSLTYDGNAELTSAEIVMPLLFFGKKNTHVGSLETLDLPDFTPMNLVTPDMAIMVERGKICRQGGMLYYRNISYQDYIALVESIRKEGKVEFYFDDNQPSTYGESVFVSNDKVIVVSYDAGGLGDIFVDDSSYVMSVMVMDGIMDGIDDDSGLFSRNSKSIKLPVLGFLYRKHDK